MAKVCLKKSKRLDFLRHTIDTELNANKTTNNEQKNTAHKKFYVKRKNPITENIRQKNSINQMAYTR